MPQVGSTQISLTEIGLTQIGGDLRMLSSPRIPRRDSLLENSEVLLICHCASLLFACCSHSMALKETFQGQSQGLCPRHFLLMESGIFPLPRLRARNRNGLVLHGYLKRGASNPANVFVSLSTSPTCHP